MRKKKMLFIYNPCAGKGAMKSKLSDVMETFMRADYEVTVYATQREREATELVMELARVQGSLMRSDVAELLRVSPSKAGSIIKEMTASGKLRLEGHGRGARYYPADPDGERRESAI